MASSPIPFAFPPLALHTPVVQHQRHVEQQVEDVALALPEVAVHALNGRLPELLLLGRLRGDGPRRAALRCARHPGGSRACGTMPPQPCALAPAWHPVDTPHASRLVDSVHSPCCCSTLTSVALPPASSSKRRRSGAASNTGAAAVGLAGWDAACSMEC